MSERQQIPIYDTQEPSEDSKRLVATFQEMESKQLDFLDQSGKNIIERIATMLAVLFAVAAFSNNFPPSYLKGNLPAKLLLIITLIFYLAAMAAGIWAIQPRSYKRYHYNVSRLKHELDRITKHKVLWLRAAGILFAFGSVTLALLTIFIIWSV